MAAQIDHPPFLGPGRHEHNLGSLRSLCFSKITSKQREVLFSELECLTHELDQMSFCGELWVDGSFLTEKLSPNDIDVVVVFWEQDVAGDPALTNFLLYELNGGKKWSRWLDTYVLPLRMSADGRYNTDSLDYWGNQWGQGRDKWLKGFVVLRLGETDVGLRLLAR